jgi:hypothetical protein
MEGDMISEKLQKSRAFIEAECVKAASAQNLCRELKHVRICFPKAPREIGKLPNSNPRYRRSANVWRKVVQLGWPLPFILDAYPKRALERSTNPLSRLNQATPRHQTHQNP